MPHNTFTHASKGLRITLEVDTNAFPSSQYGSFLLGHALMVLITEAKVTEWEKARGEMDEDSFLATVLTGVARDYNATHSLPQDDDKVYDTLKQLLDHLHESVDL